jgi:hypothetical protein
VGFARIGGVAGRIVVQHRLQHGRILSAKVRVSNRFFFWKKNSRRKIRLAKRKKSCSMVAISGESP